MLQSPVDIISGLYTQALALLIFELDHRDVKLFLLYVMDVVLLPV